VAGGEAEGEGGCAHTVSSRPERGGAAGPEGGQKTGGPKAGEKNLWPAGQEGVGQAVQKARPKAFRKTGGQTVQPARRQTVPSETCPQARRRRLAGRAAGALIHGDSG
jgi:hypothetical protein